VQDQPYVLTFPANLEGFERAFADLRQWLGDLQATPKAQYNVELVFEEIVTNIVRYGYDQPDGESVVVELCRDSNELAITFDDGGRPFDPLAKPDPTLPHSIEEAKVGGLGLMLVRKATTEMAYERTAAGRNRLNVRIALD